MFIDTHAHLFYPNYNDDVGEVINRAKNSGIDFIIVPGTDTASSSQAVDLADKTCTTVLLIDYYSLPLSHPDHIVHA